MLENSSKIISGESDTKCKIGRKIYSYDLWTVEETPENPDILKNFTLLGRGRCYSIDGIRQLELDIGYFWIKKIKI